LELFFLLYAKALDKFDMQFVQGVEQLLLHLDQSQVSRVGIRFVGLIHFYTDNILKNGHSARGVKYLAEGCKKFKPHSECLTGIHSDYLACCLKTMNLKHALPMLKSPVFDLQPDKTGINPKEMLLYYYYGGMIFLGLKMNREALDFFDTALTVPAFAMNAIMVEAFKKFVLTSLLLDGKYTGISKNASNIVHRHIKVYCQPYLEFATAFDKHDIEKCTINSVTNKEAYKKDNNTGLIKLCVSALSRNTIQRLTETYLTLSLSDIAKMAKLKDTEQAEKILLSMIQNGEIKGVINQKNKMVSFNEEIVEFNTNQTFARLDSKIQSSVELAYRLKKMDQDLGKSITYLAKLHGVREEMFEMNQQRKGGLGRLFDMFK
jgi:COP9 signalosome complex subunit 3